MLYPLSYERKLGLVYGTPGTADTNLGYSAPG
jgi:hypothetical protein